jgi:1-acyl-sn-glycerol-3-phosphate acyltransferase
VIVLSILGALLFLVSTVVCSILSVVVSLIDPSGKSYLWLARVWSKSCLFSFGIRVRVVGTEHLQRGRNYVYAANHSSYMDIPILLAYIPDNLRLTLRSSLTRIPIWGWALLVGPFLILDRSNPQRAQRTIGKAIERIQSGASVLFFPEGTRTMSGTMQPFKRGAFHLAQDARVPVVPIALIGAYRILPRHKWLPRWGLRAEIIIGEPIDPPPIAPEAASEKRAEEIRLMQEAERRVIEMLTHEEKAFT